MRTGLWIPVEIEALPLNLSEKVLLAEIVSLDRVGECFASNEHFSKLLGVRPDSASRMISKLKKLGYIKQTGFDGRKRKLIPIFQTTLKPKEELPLTKNLASKSTQHISKTKSRVGESAEAGFAISNEPIMKVQSQYNVHNRWDEFLKWSKSRISQTSYDTITEAGNPARLRGSGKCMWEMWNKVG
ncbi:Orf5 [Leptospira ellinghausenii]|uniref:Orf5 n=1 Tax=Leptospira ellinghausenii TaxID=1917822 RepID=A0A2P2DII6_9LEPT|nr:helix-turn-helix domain-containing protein [Leptospira ellinghausenii]GBF44466.1 Orf5 [Leptospira ellinghausenii]